MMVAMGPRDSLASSSVDSPRVKIGTELEFIGINLSGTLLVHSSPSLALINLWD